MVNKKYIMVSMEDERAGKIAEVLGNKTCKKIIDFLSDKNQASEKDIADALKIPMNTAEYNLKKLLDSELIEKTKHFFWSSKGKKIPMYKLSNKSIVISPKSRISSKLISVVPALIIGGIGAVLIKYLVKPTEILVKTDNLYSGTAGSAANSAAPLAEAATSLLSTLQALPNWYWFSMGILLTSILVIVFNWRKL